MYGVKSPNWISRAMTTYCRDQGPAKAARRCLCLAGILFVLAAHVVSLAMARYHLPAGQDDWQLLLGGLLLGSVLPLLALSRFMPDQAASLRRAWLTQHFTWGDDLARRAVLMLYELQVKPVLDYLGLAAPDKLSYWWWTLTGMLLMALAAGVSGSGISDETHTGPEDEEAPAVTEEPEVVDGGARLAIESPADPGAAPAPPSYPCCRVLLGDNRLPDIN